MASIPLAELTRMKNELLEHASFLVDVRGRAAKIAEAISTVHTNAATAHAKLIDVHAAAIKKEGADVAAMDADRDRLAKEIDHHEALKVSKLEAEAVVMDNALAELIRVGDKARDEYLTAGGAIPEEGWEAAGAALFAKKQAEEKAERASAEAAVAEAVAAMAAGGSGSTSTTVTTT